MSSHYQRLLELYPDALVRAGRVYPAVVRDGSHWQRLLVDPAPRAPDRTLSELGAVHLAKRRADDPALTNGPTTCWQGDGRDGVRVTGGRYFDMLATCDALKAEFDDDDGARPLAQLPLRALAHALAGDPLSSGQGRDAAIGISVILTVPQASIPRTAVPGDSPPIAGLPATERFSSAPGFVIGYRHVSSDRGTWHVAPSGMLEPTDDPNPIAATVATELEEELGLRIGSAAVADRMVMLGLTQDLLRLKPDLVVRLDLAAAEVPAELAAVSEFSELAFVTADRDGLAAFWREHDPDLLTPAAAGAVALLEASLVR